MAQDLIAALKGRAAPSIPPPEGSRDLTPDDIRASMTVSRDTKGPQLSRVTHRHHQIARLLAAGMRQVDICAETGITQARLSVLSQDPAIETLVEYYATEVRSAYADVHRALATLGGVAVDQLLEDLEERPHLFSVKDKLEIAEMALERSGVAPGTKHPGAPQGGGLSINISFQKPEGPLDGGPLQVIDITPQIATPGPPPAEDEAS